jgi:hypothetical protein
MQIDVLYKVRDILITQYAVPETTAEYAARLYPFLSKYPYGVSSPLAAGMLERTVRHTKEHFTRLRDLGVFEMPRNGAWTFRKDVKEVIDACH